MKILITTHHLKNYSGSKRWVYTIAEELAKNHDVTVATPIWGDMADKMQAICKTVMLDKIEGKFDLGIINQVQTKSAIKFCKKTVYVIHGNDEADKPLTDCNYHFAVSQELKDKHPFAELLINPIDTQEYNYNKKVLYISNDGKLAPMITKVCAELKYEFKHLRHEWEVVENIKWADIVISVGRGVLESMSCGKEVIIADYRQYNSKPLMEKDYQSGKYANWSGRTDRIEITEELLKNRLLGNRKIILDNHNVKNICNQILCVV